jgi:hypothetical protein
VRAAISSIDLGASNMKTFALILVLIVLADVDGGCFAEQSRTKTLADVPPVVLFREAFDDRELLDRGGYDGKFYDSSQSPFTDDQWPTVEAYFPLNSLEVELDRPNPDGVMRAWFDGLLIVDRQDLILRSIDFLKMKFNRFLLTPCFGPGMLPHAQALWIDDLVVATNRVHQESLPAE